MFPYFLADNFLIKLQIHPDLTILHFFSLDQFMKRSVLILRLGFIRQFHIPFVNPILL